MAANNSVRIRKLVAVALFIALAYVVEFVFRIKVSFLTFDVKDTVIAVCAMIFGPVSGLAASAVLSFLEFVTLSETGFWGMIMNFVGSASFSVAASLIYRYKKSFAGAIVSVLAAVAVTVVMMLGANLLITPIYTGTSVPAVAGMIPKLLLPFNLAKYVLNGGLILLIYKPVMQALRSMNIVPKGSAAWRFDRKTAVMLVLAAVMLAVSVFLLVRLGGIVEWFPKKS